MSNSVVKVTDDMLNDSLLLLVGEDGTVTPDRQTVETYLSSQTGATNIQIMHINKTDTKNIDLTMDNLTYVPDADSYDIIPKEQDLDTISRNLYNFKLDHDYTPLTSPRRESPLPEEMDELAKTLSILDGGIEEPVQIIENQKPSVNQQVIAQQVMNIIHKQTTPQPTQTTTPVVVASQQPPPLVQSTETPQQKIEKTPIKSKPKIINTQPKSTPKKPKAKAKQVVQEEDNSDDLEDEDFDIDFEEDDNDSDFELEEVNKSKTPKRSSRSRTKSESTPKSKKTTPKPIKQPEPKVEDKLPQPETPKVEKSPETPKSAEQDKKPPKKEKKTPKPIPDDFALFSTPDIIRRVGGKEPTTPVTPTTPDPTKPAKISQESRSKSTSDPPQSPTKHNRLSLDHKIVSDKENKSATHERRNSDPKSKERRQSVDTTKSKRLSVDEKPKTEQHKKSDSINKSSTSNSKSSDSNESVESSLDQMPSAEDIRAIIMNENTKSFTTSSLPPVPDVFAAGSDEQNNINLDAGGLDLDQTLLDNINTDLIPEDILYQVAQSLVSNTELQNAIDKGLNEGNLVLDPSIQQAMGMDQSLTNNLAHEDEDKDDDDDDMNVVQKGMQIVRPDGRIVVIPPIERPTTRSRNKRKPLEKAVKPSFKTVHKPLDDEHVSGNELDSSGEEEESEDDPNKLWCICNQPHNNRFMICCDTCEEWYHGKCVNITKAMGQQMESEGKEWICLYCKDPSLRRPQAAARRIRKASRNSRASTDSTGSTQKSEKGEKSPASSVPCVVCQKPARKNSIFCSETCILAHAQGVEKVVVFERSTGNMLTGSKAPSAAQLDQWLKEHPGYEVVRSAGKVVTAKAQNLTQSKLKFVKNSDNEGVSLAVHKKGVSVGVLKHSPSLTNQKPVPKLKGQITGFKIISKQVNTGTPPTTKSKVIEIPPSPKPQPTATTPVKQKTVQTTLKVNNKTPTSNKEKPMPVKTPKSRQAEQVTTPQQTTPKPQENIRENVQKTLFEQLTNRLKLVEDLKLTEDEVKGISTEIESQLHKCFGDTGQKYRNKYRSLIFNIKDVKNQTLWRRICEKSINPYELVRLSPDDLASQELALWREREAKHQLDMIKKSELELLNCNRQYVLKTHKGEQVLEDNRPTDKIDNTEVIKSLTEGSTLDSGETKRDSSKDRDKKSSSKHSHKDKDRDRDRKSSKDKNSKDHHRHRSSSKDRDRDRSRKRSRSRDHSSRHEKKRSRSRDKHRKNSHKSSRHKKETPLISTTDKLDKKSKEILEQLVDNKIVPPLEDRLWKHVPQEDILPASVESDSDHEPTSTVTIPTPPRSSEPDDFITNPSSKSEKEFILEERSTSPVPRIQPQEIWKGTINMIDVAQITITAHEVSGDCQGLGTELASNLDIVGRISPETVWEYIGKMKCSNSKTISLVRLVATNEEEKMPYLALYGYLSSRNRLGVVKSMNKAVKDFYIYPLASKKPIPQALLPLNGPGFEESRPALLLGIIVRDKRKRPYLEPVTPVTPPVIPTKKVRVETPPLPAIVPPVAPTRSYTPPPVKDPRLSKLPLPPTVPAIKDDDDEPYSPEDSDPEIVPTPPAPVEAPTPVVNKFDELSGLGAPILPSNTLEIQRQMEELNKKIEMQKSEINSISQTIVSSHNPEIGTNALANIALPSNLQQILDSIKTIGAVATPETADVEAPENASSQDSQTDLTIPLMIPKTFSRPLSSTSTPKVDLTSDTIPLNLPVKPKIKPASVNSPILDVDRGGSVLSSLSEEELIRKAAEMLGDNDDSRKRKPAEVKPPLPFQSSSSSPSLTQNLPLTPPTSKRLKIDLTQPPVPGIDDEVL